MRGLERLDGYGIGETGLEGLKSGLLFGPRAYVLARVGIRMARPEGFQRRNRAFMSF